jgi:anthranilate phosphoribosyltransferase
VHRLVAGERWPVRDAVLLNAASAIAAYDDDPGTTVDRLRTALVRAADAIDSGAAAAKLTAWVEACETVAGPA